MFRSTTRPVVYSQAEHARLSAAIAAAWQPALIALPFDPFVRGVALHDRGYGELDNDPIGDVEETRWIEIMRRGFEPQNIDPIVDLVVALHIRRLVGGRTNEFDAAIPALIEAAGVSEADAMAADAVTDVCDRISFAFCLEEEDSGSVGSVAFDIAADGTATLGPWPLTVPDLGTTVIGYQAAGYPLELDAVERRFELRPA
jgi:Protein of unknown function (DUF3891)